MLITALLAVVAVTLLNVRGMISVHVFVGMLLIPPVLVKIDSSAWRFVRYYSGSPPYRKKGPPHPLLRLLGPVLVVLTTVLIGSGMAVVLTPHLRPTLLFVHQASFFGWLAVLGVHFLGHLGETVRLAPLDLAHRTGAQVAGASARQRTVAAALAAGVVLGVIMLGTTAHYLRATVQYIHNHHH